MHTVSVHWFRRDLRLGDNAALYHALKSGLPVVCVFIFDSDILDDLKENNLTEDKRVQFIYEEVVRLKKELNTLGSDLHVYYGRPVEVWKKLVSQFPIKSVFTNHDYEPYATERDQRVKSLLEEKRIIFHTYKDQVIFERSEIVKDDGQPYAVYTPYSRKWKAKLSHYFMKSFPTEKYFSSFANIPAQKIPSLKSMGFNMISVDFPSRDFKSMQFSDYAETRDFPGILGTSRLGVHLRFGTISIRQLVDYAWTTNAEKYLNELIWREFYMMILYHFPHVVDRSFNPAYDKVQWRNNESEFTAWCEGRTGYAIVDAGMRELNATGFMHNRVRMIAASFLTKHLLIDWRWGEAYFAKKLLDYELASNNGGWQWVAGCGVDAAPYFRIFNPMTQEKKFDKEYLYIQKWIPGFSDTSYMRKIVEHEPARNRYIIAIKNVLKPNM